MGRVNAADYVDGSSARAIKYDIYSENNYLKQKKKSRSYVKTKLRLVAAVILMFAIGCTVMYRYALVMDINSTIRVLENKYEQLEDENSQLKIDIEEQTDLNEIKRIAQEELGMRSPTSNQIIYVKVEGKDRTLLSGAYSDQKYDSPGNSMFAALLDNVKRLVKLLY
ncbi:MAG: cell division protein FtsL [Eubacteriales bacterium]|nr:cell division protein FtsL [Eubacteriales bacterium]